MPVTDQQLHQQEHHSTINIDTLLTITLRHMNDEKLLLYAAVTHTTGNILDAVIFTHPSMGKKILIQFQEYSLANSVKLLRADLQRAG